MQTIVTQLLAIPIIISFTLLPGAWVACGLPLDALRWPVRLAFSGVLSPIILALQMLLLKALGLPFVLIPLVLFVVNLPALYLIWRIVRTAQAVKWREPALYGGLALLGILALYVLLPWQVIPNLRTFAWHALWHTDISYALTRNTFLPEEPELAGVTLAYGWVGHVYWSIIGWSTNLPPTQIYALSNLIWLLFTFILAYALGIGLRLQRAAALLNVGLLFLGTNVIGAIAWTVNRDWHWQQNYLGDIRYTPLLGKYLGFETMPFAFALLIAVALLSTLALQQPIRNLAVLLFITLTGLGLVYPILFPAGCLLVGGLWVLLVTRLDPATPIYRWRELLWLAAGVGASVFVTFAFLTIVTQDRSNGAVGLSTMQEMKPKLFHLLSALLLFAPALVAVVPHIWQRFSPTLLLTATALGVMVLYVVANLDTLEYKYILAATIVAAPVAAAGIERVLVRRPRLQWGLALVMPVAFFIIHQTLMLKVGAQIPSNLVHAPRLSEDSFWLSLADSEANADWTAAVRTLTPENTVVITENSAIHISSFLARALYAPSDGDGTQTAGYSVDNRFNLLTWRGYPVQLYEERLAVIKTIYNTTDTTEMNDALAQVMTLHRPVVIAFRPTVPMVQWLREEAIGQELFASTSHVVWLLEPNIIINGQNQRAAK